MNEEEPAWRAELREVLDEEFISSGAEIFDLVVPYIQAAEERGRRQALSAVSAEIDSLKGVLPKMSARAVWKWGYEGALVRMSLFISHSWPEQP